MSSFRTFPIESIALGDACQMRAQSSPEVIDEYAETYRTTPDAMPPPRVFLVAGLPQVVDGYHRVTAATAAHLSFLRCEIVGEGTSDDAAWAACAANLTHGIRRSNADKRRAVTAALTLRPESSDRAIAEWTGVSQPFVGSCRPQVITVITPTPEHTPQRIDKRGVSRPAAQPRREPSPEPAAAPLPPAIVEPDHLDRSTLLAAIEALAAARAECARALPVELAAPACESFATASMMLRSLIAYA